VTGTQSGFPDPQYVAARTVLLDALDALAGHRGALVVVGAQAVYLRTGSAGLLAAPYTTDGDLAVDPTVLGEDPLLEDAMGAAGFYLRPLGPGIVPGTWMGAATVAGQRYDVPVDLIVPAGALPGGNTRGARLPGHGRRAAKRTHGLEASLVDHDPMSVRGLAPGDLRVVDVAVAGVAALLVSKVIKLRDRVDGARPHRQNDKDAGDVLRLIRATPLPRMADQLHTLRGDPTAGEVTTGALDGLDVLFRAPGSPGVAMAVRSVQLDLPAVQVETQLTVYVRELRRRLAATR